MQIPLDPVAGLLAVCSAIFLARANLASPARMAADTRPAYSSPFTNTLGHDHKRIVSAAETRCDTEFGLSLLAIAFAVQVASLWIPEWLPRNPEGWSVLVLVPVLITVFGWWFRPRRIGLHLDRVAQAQDRKVIVRGQPVDHSHDVAEMKVELHRASCDERLRKHLRSRWGIGGVEDRIYTNML